EPAMSAYDPSMFLFENLIFSGHSASLEVSQSWGKGSGSMFLTKNLLERPANLSAASVYSAVNGVIYLTAGVLLIVWPGVTQTLFMDRDFVGCTSERSSAFWA